MTTLALAGCFALGAYLFCGGAFLLGITYQMLRPVDTGMSGWQIRKIAYLWPLYAWRTWRELR